jgi:hypothetical protein
VSSLAGKTASRRDRFRDVLRISRSVISARSNDSGCGISSLRQFPLTIELSCLCVSGIIRLLASIRRITIAAILVTRSAAHGRARHHSLPAEVRGFQLPWRTKSPGLPPRVFGIACYDLGASWRPPRSPALCFLELLQQNGHLCKHDAFCSGELRRQALISAPPHSGGPRRNRVDG